MNDIKSATRTFNTMCNPTYAPAIYPLQKILMSNINLPIFIIDDLTQKVIGKPRLNVGIDVNSQTIWAIDLSLQGNDISRILNTVKHGLFTKEWGVTGIPDEILVDSSDGLDGITKAIGTKITSIEPIYENYMMAGLFFQRLLDELFSKLPSNPNYKYVEVGKTKIKYVCLTYNEAKRIVTEYITEVYHCTNYGNLPYSKTPMEMYIEGISLNHPRVIEPSDEKKVRFALMPEATRCCKKDGISIRGIRYNSPELTRSIDPMTKVRVKYDDGDTSKVYVMNPRNNQYIVVPSANQAADVITGMSRYQLEKLMYPKKRR